MKTPNTIEIVIHHDKDDEDCGGDYVAVSVKVDGEVVRRYGDFYHDQGDVAAKAFVAGLNFALGSDIKPIKTRVADGGGL